MKLEAHTRLQASGELFLPPRLVMLDCEMEGLNPRKDALLQIAAIKLELRANQYVPVAFEKPLNIYLHSDAQPESDFARKFMTDVYRKCNESQISEQQARPVLDEWMGDWRGLVSPTGDCVPTDVLFLWARGVIDISHFDGDTPVPGTFFYEFFDMNSIKALARQKMGSKFDKQLPRHEGDHDALVDCLNQLIELNAFIEVLLQ